MRTKISKAVWFRAKIKRAFFVKAALDDSCEGGQMVRWPVGGEASETVSGQGYLVTSEKP